MRTHTLLARLVSPRVRAVGLGVWLLAAVPGSAQTTLLQTEVQMHTGLLSFFTGAGRAVKVTVTEVGGRTVQSQVRIVYRDATDRVVAREDGVLTRSRPVTFELPLLMADPKVQLRASISILGVAGRPSQPIVVLEDVDHGSLAIEQRISCAPPASREGPVTPYCPDVVVSQITIGG
jgi:hypothetical protein